MCHTLNVGILLRKQESKSLILVLELDWTCVQQQYKMHRNTHRKTQKHTLEKRYHYISQTGLECMRSSNLKSSTSQVFVIIARHHSHNLGKSFLGTDLHGVNVIQHPSVLVKQAD